MYIAGVFKVLGVRWELPPKFSRIFYLGGMPRAIFYSEVVFGMLLNKCYATMYATKYPFFGLTEFFYFFYKERYFACKAACKISR